MWRCKIARTDATVAIVTKDRREVLRQVVASLLQQTVRSEVLVLDDASSDGTLEMLRAEFPSVRSVRSETPLGCVAQRTEAGRLAQGQILLFLDDDIELRSHETVERTLEEFDHPRVGAVAMPFMEAWDAPRVRFRAPASEPVFATFRFAGGACAVRRSLFLELGGFRPELFLQSEETDYCLRMLAAGFVTRLGTGPPLLHLRLPPDDLRAKAMYGVRNEVLHAWRNVPMPYLAVRLVKVFARGAVVGVGSRHPLAAARGAVLGIRHAIRSSGQRQPVPRRVYRLAHRLKTRGAVPLGEIEHELPPAQIEDTLPLAQGGRSEN